MAHTPLFRSFMLALQKARRDNLEAVGKPPPMTKGEALWTRRRFLGTAAVAAGSAFATGMLPHRDRAWGGERLKPRAEIAVIGGGIAELHAAFQLQKAGYPATVYEARRRLGGRILSVTGAVGEGLVTDLGGQLINTDHADMLALVEEFGLQLFNRTEDAERLPFPETGSYFDGEIRPEEEVADKLRPLAEQIAADAAKLNQDFEQFAPLFDQRSVAQYLDEHADKIPAPFIRDLIEHSIRTEYGVEPDASSALQLLFNLPTVEGKDVEVLGASDETSMVEGGSGQIIAALAQALSRPVQLGMVLRRITSQRSGFRLTFVGREVVEAFRLGTARAQGQRMVQQLEQVIPGAQDAVNDRFLRTRWTQNRFSRGSYTSFKPGQLTTFGGFLYIESDDPDERQDVHVGNLVFAGEHLSDAFYGFMNGAAQTGRLAAKVVFDSIQEQAQSRARRPS